MWHANIEFEKFFCLNWTKISLKQKPPESPPPVVNTTATSDSIRCIPIQLEEMGKTIRQGYFQQHRYVLIASDTPMQN